MRAASWLGYSDEKMKGLLEQSKIDGFHHYKLKVGGDLERDLRRLKLFRDVNGWDDILMLDSNQVRLSPLIQTSLPPEPPFIYSLVLDLVCPRSRDLPRPSRSL